jgi:hypothetical protein
MFFVDAFFMLGVHLSCEWSKREHDPEKSATFGIMLYCGSANASVSISMNIRPSAPTRR